MISIFSQCICGEGGQAKLCPTGNTLVHFIYLGGPDFDEGLAIVVDSSGNAYVTGRTMITL